MKSADPTPEVQPLQIMVDPERHCDVKINEDSGTLWIRYYGTFYPTTLKVFLQQFTVNGSRVNTSDYGTGVFMSLFRFYGADTVSDYLKQLFPFSSEDQPIASCSSLRGYSIQLYKEPEQMIRLVYFLEEHYLGTEVTKFEYIHNNLSMKSVPAEELLRCMKQLREHYPPLLLQLSALCTEPRNQTLPSPARELDAAQTARLKELADTFFEAVPSPLLSPSRDKAADRLEAMHRIYDYICSLNLSLEQPFFGDSLKVREGFLDYKYYSRPTTCYDGGCHSDWESTSDLCLKLHPADAWDELLACSGHQRKLESYCTRESLCRGDCACFFSGKNHSMFMKQPFGLDLVLETWIVNQW